MSEFGSVGAPRDFVAEVKRTAEAMLAERVGEPCGPCGKTRNDDGSPVKWMCASCKRLVCRDCTLTIPGETRGEYYEQTFCSKACNRPLRSGCSAAGGSVARNFVG